MPRARPHYKFITHRIAIHIREQDIEYDEVRMHLSRGSAGIRTPGSDLHIVPFPIEKDADKLDVSKSSSTIRMRPVFILCSSLLMDA